MIKDEVAFPKPAVLGHEVSGIVRQVGERVTHVQPGDRVACSFIMPCGACRHCAEGLEDLCENFFNYNRLRGQLYDGSTRLTREGEDIAMYSMGGHATHCVVPSRAVFALPGTVPLADAAVLAGIAPAGHTMDVDITKVVRRKLKIYGSFGAAASITMPEVIQLAAEGKINLDKLITHRFTFEQTAETYQLLNERKVLGRGLIVTNPALA